MPIDITVVTAQGDTVVTVFNDSASQVFRIPLAAAPVGITLDREGWILKKVVSVSPIPREFVLDQNYPNPFNTVSHIRYYVLRQFQITLVIYDLLGRQVATLVDNSHEPGWYTVTWRGRDQEGVPAASGVYFYRIDVRNPNDGVLNFSHTRKMLLLK